MKYLTRRDFLQASSLAAACTAFAPTSFAQGVTQSFGKYNVLFIAVDDLRPQLGCYGFPLMKTPHIDRLAANGILFERAYCQQAVCNPSRASVLTGLRPDTTRVYDLQTHFRLNVPTAVTLPQQFKKHGYHAQALSKIYHTGLDDPDSWSVRHWSPKSSQYVNPEILQNLEADRLQHQAENEGPVIEVLQKDPKTGQPLKLSPPKFRVRGPSWESANVSEDALPDGETTDRTLELLNALKDQPFFLSVGFLKPHLPFVAPKDYFDLYPLDTITLPTNPTPPKDAPEMAMHQFGELRNYNDIPPEGPLTDQKSRELIRAYYASISYVDSQIGRIIHELDRLGLRENTVIVLWGDHGWHLGDHGLWCKHTIFERAVHAPLIISTPDTYGAPLRTDKLVEFVDIYPTLCELCGIPVPDNLEGISFAPLLKDPNRPWKQAAFSQYPRGKDRMGYSVRTDRYRYTEWINIEPKNLLAVELYDHASDPDETVNLAGLPENQERIKQLSHLLHEGWRGVLPPGIHVQ